MTPIDRAARALEEELLRQHKEDNLGHFLPRDSGVDWLTVDGNIRVAPVIRAVLEAIREPSADMERAAENLEPRADWWPDEPGPRNSPAEHWAAMIDALLDEAPTPPA